MKRLKQYSLDVPLVVYVGKIKIALNLNNYRNCHYYLSNKAKIVFKEKIYPKLQSLPRFKRITLITYTWFPQTQHLSDISNWCSVVDKFFCDALVSAEKIKDDNFTMIQAVNYRYGAFCPDNPRMTVTIKGYTYET